MFYKTLKVIIAGTRDFDNYPLLVRKCNGILKKYDFDNVQIISGGARGADYYGELYAKQKHYNLSVYPADWDKYGKSARYRRNVLMAEKGNVLIAFWDGKSKGTKHMIDIANQHNLKVHVIKY